MFTLNELWIPRATFREMCEFGYASYPMETGGLLIGYEADNGALVVTAAIGPGPNGRHFRHRFIPDTEYQAALLEAHHVRTGGTESYLGDWHTHPDGALGLSRRDKKTLRNIASTPEAYLSQPVMAVLAPGRRTWQVGGFRLIGWKARLFFCRYEIRRLHPRLYERSKGAPQSMIAERNGRDRRVLG